MDLADLELIAATLNMPSRRYRGGFLYVFRAGESCKIGISHKPLERMASLQKSCPMILALEGAWDYHTKAAALLAERALHQHFSELRIHSEWFGVDASTAAEAARELYEKCQLAAGLELEQFM